MDLKIRYRSFISDMTMNSKNKSFFLYCVTSKDNINANLV